MHAKYNLALRYDIKRNIKGATTFSVTTLSTTTFRIMKIIVAINKMLH